MSVSDPVSRASLKPALRLAALLGVLASLCVIVMVLGDQRGWFQRMGLEESTTDTVFGIVTGMLFAGAVVTLIKARFGGTSPAEGRIDEFQRQQRRMLIAITVLVTGFGAMTIINPFHHNGVVSIDFAIEFALLAIAAAAAATFGVGFLRRRYRLAASDEFVQAIRARAVQFGYLVAIIGLSATYMVYVFRPSLIDIALPSVLLVGVIAPAIYFLIAERRANG